MLRENLGEFTLRDITTIVVNPFCEVYMITCDLMSEYYKMCVAAGLNHYRLVPDVDDLFKLSGWTVSYWVQAYAYYAPIYDDNYNKFGRWNERVMLQIIKKCEESLTWFEGDWVDECEIKEFMLIPDFLEEYDIGDE